VRCALIRKKPCTIKCCKRSLISGFAILLPECVDRFQQIVPARSQFSGKAGVFRARRIGDSGFLFSGGNICVKEIDDPGEVGNQVGYLGRLPYGVETPKMALVFHIVTSKWSSLAHLENLAACRGCIAIPAPRSRTGETDPGLRRRKPAGCLARSALQGPPHRRWLRGFQPAARSRRRLLPGRPAVYSLPSSIVESSQSIRRSVFAPGGLAGPSQRLEELPGGRSSEGRLANPGAPHRAETWGVSIVMTAPPDFGRCIAVAIGRARRPVCR